MSASIAALPNPGSPAWQREMERIIARGHTAAWIAGQAERLGVKPDSPLISQARLSRAERAEIKAIVDAQLRYFRGFQADIAGMSEAQIKARALLYSGATRATLYTARWGDWDVPQRLMPGNQDCVSRCLCTISIKDNGDGTGMLTRAMGGTEHHCTSCPPLAGDHPIRRRGYVETKHMRGAHDQRSHGRRGGRGDGSANVQGGNEPASPDVQRRLQNIDDELANRYISAGRRQALEKQRQELMGGTATQTNTVPDTPTPANASQRLQNIEAELASPYTSPGRRTALEGQRAELIQQSGGGVQGLRQSLDTAESEVRGLRYERAIFLSPSGQRLAQANGDEKSYSLSQQQMQSLRGSGATMTHNHPGGYKYTPSDPRHQGSSFSIQDIRQAAYLELAEVRAVTPTRRYWMKPPPGGWKEHHWQKTIPNSYQKHHKSVVAEMAREVRAGRLTVAQADARVYHEIWSRVSNELGLPYGYEDR